jgi:hypothetical protein
LEAEIQDLLSSDSEEDNLHKECGRASKRFEEILEEDTLQKKLSPNSDI